MIEVHPIFQTPIFVYDLKGMTDAHGLDTYVKKCCDETPGKFGSREVVQSRYDLNKDVRVAPLRQAIQDITTTIARDVYKYSPSYVVEITSMWGNIQRPGAMFRSHVHHNNIFSGVFYLNEDADFPPITFWRPVETTLDPRKVDYNIFNQGSFARPVRKDHLIIFPAWLHHSVDINNTTKDRLGVSFNVMLRGDYYNVTL
jgi:uncharacterized protein (TIGR02466 family)